MNSETMDKMSKESLKKNEILYGNFIVTDEDGNRINNYRLVHNDEEILSHSPLVVDEGALKKGVRILVYKKGYKRELLDYYGGQVEVCMKQGNDSGNDYRSMCSGGSFSGHHHRHHRKKKKSFISRFIFWLVCCIFVVIAVYCTYEIGWGKKLKKEIPYASIYQESIDSVAQIDSTATPATPSKDSIAVRPNVKLK